MTKTKELVRIYNANPDKDKASCAVAQILLKEAVKLLEEKININDTARVDTVRQILRDKEAKWKNFVRKTGDEALLLDGFRNILIKRSPKFGALL